MHPDLLLLIGISFSMGFTPGPNNAVASYSGFNFGIKKTIPLIFGVGLGYTLLSYSSELCFNFHFSKISNNTRNNQNSWNNFFILSSL